MTGLCRFCRFVAPLRLYYQMMMRPVPWAHTGRAGGFLRSNHALLPVPLAGSDNNRGHHHDLR